MIKVSVLYPNGDGAKFDMDYYCNRHMKLVADRLGAACKGISAEYGVAGGQPGSKPTYIAMGHLLFESADAMQKAMGQHGPELMGDVPNFTNTQPTVQVSEVRM